LNLDSLEVISLDVFDRKIYDYKFEVEKTKEGIRIKWADNQDYQEWFPESKWEGKDCK
jgi:hypothetical protein